MHLKIFTIVFSTQTYTFQSTQLEQFQSTHIIEDIQTHFFEVASLPCLLVLIRYLPIDVAQSIPDFTGKSSKRRPNQTSIPLDGDSREFAELLKDWRRKRSASDGVPAYLVLTNRQVANIARLRPLNLKQLGEMEGIGASKLQKYGEEILAIIQTISAPKQNQKEELK
jgi:superfamily II DNA helicase RecQ